MKTRKQPLDEKLDEQTNREPNGTWNINNALLNLASPQYIIYNIFVIRKAPLQFTR